MKAVLTRISLLIAEVESLESEFPPMWGFASLNNLTGEEMARYIAAQELKEKLRKQISRAIEVVDKFGTEK
mgnify:CR=1 FL=1